tara:strand:- start:743 stop:1207 length:465 start_codon:yes stop_codon:yes gene_type:complete
MTNQQIYYAGFWKRICAFALDALLQTLVISFPLYFLLNSSSSFDYHSLAALWLESGLIALFVIVFWRYKSATPGKMLFHMEVVDAQTLAPLPTSRLILRYFSYLLSILPLFLGVFMMGWTERKQGLHDKIARSVVVIKQKKYVEETSEADASPV